MKNPIPKTSHFFMAVEEGRKNFLERAEEFGYDVAFSMAVKDTCIKGSAMEYITHKQS